MSALDKYWSFIAKYLPNYYSRDDVLWSDILNRYISDEDVSEEDIEYIEQTFANKDDVIEECMQLENRLFAEAIENYYSQLK